MFLNENILLKNLIQPLDKEKALNEFLSECRQKNVSFELLGFKKRLSFDTFFLFQYEIKVSENGNSNQYSIKQKVYFFPSEKHFGTQTKNVWQLKLGEIE
ncbi:conserved hypothetical protein [Flavobacterium sp. 9AF]|nr:conserved hypothetical protein [Flavobacterium sp. 9AF]